MEIEVKVSNLSKEDIISILAAGFSSGWYENGNEHTIEEMALMLLEGQNIILKSYKVGGIYKLSLNLLSTGIGLFIKNGGGTSPCKYDLVDGDKTMQYSLFGELMFWLKGGE